MYYLIEHRGLRDPVVKTVNETSMAERLGERYGVAVHEVPVGFKYVGPKMIETGAMMGGEESGGFGFGMHLPERDGIFADLMLLDLFLREKEAGRWPVSKAMAHLHEIAGPSSYRRVDVHFDRAVYPALKEPPARRAAAEGAARPGRQSRRSDADPLHERRLQVLRRRRVVAAGPIQRHGAARPGLHGGRLDRRRGRQSGAGERIVRGAVDDRRRPAQTVPRRRRVTPRRGSPAGPALSWLAAVQ